MLLVESFGWVRATGIENITIAVISNLQCLLSVACGGAANISNVMGAGLWAIDYMLQMAQLNIQVQKRVLFLLTVTQIYQESILNMGHFIHHFCPIQPIHRFLQCMHCFTECGFSLNRFARILSFLSLRMYIRQVSFFPSLLPNARWFV